MVDDHPANLLVLQQQLARFNIQADGLAEGRALLRRRECQRQRPTRRVLCSTDAQLLALPLRENERVMIKPVQLGDISALLTDFAPDPLAAFVNAIALLVITALIIWEALWRFYQPQPVTAAA
nr:Zinc transporter ZitB [Candidatus Pantoea persica]